MNGIHEVTGSIPVRSTNLSSPFLRAVLVTASWACLTSALASAAERASYDSAGKLTSIIHDGAELDVRAGFAVRFDGGVDVPVQPHDERSTVVRDGLNLRWSGTTPFPNGASATFHAGWTEADGSLAFDGSIASAWWQPVAVLSVDYVIDLPRDTFAGGTLQPGGATLATSRAADPTIFRRKTDSLTFADRANNWTVSILLDGERDVSVTDRWDADGRSYRVRVSLKTGIFQPGETLPLRVSMKVGGTAAVSPVRVVLDHAGPRHPFDGFGANFCWGTENPAATDYMLEQLRIAWSRHELKAVLWDQQRAAPGPELVAEFERIQRVQRMGVPWMMSVWRVPERFYVDANRRPLMDGNRRIAGDRWDEVLELFGSYLLHLKERYGAEPDLFSFNEPDRGVFTGFTAAEHADMVKRIGAHLQRLGLKTRMVLGDTGSPNATHTYVLPAAADPDAVRYAGALSVHSWRSGTREEYGAWSDLASWLNLPLLVGESGVDPYAWRNRAYDSYDYGLTEAKQALELIRFMRPRSLLYWQFTEDFGLVRTAADGRIEPTGRFWLMKHFTNLTPPSSQAIAVDTDRPDVVASAFSRADGAFALHVLNTGALSRATLAGLPAGRWQVVTTTEDAGWRESVLASLDGGALELPARSLTTLVKQP